MDAVKYFEERERLLNSLGRTGDLCTGIHCEDCPFNTNTQCIIKKTESVEIVEKWSKENPEKTMLNDLLEKHPKMSMNIEGVPRNICPHDLAYCKEMYCGYNTKDCKTCWNRPLER